MGEFVAPCAGTLIDEVMGADEGPSSPTFAERCAFCMGHSWACSQRQNQVCELNRQAERAGVQLSPSRQSRVEFRIAQFCSRSGTVAPDRNCCLYLSNICGSITILGNALLTSIKGRQRLLLISELDST